MVDAHMAIRHQVERARGNREPGPVSPHELARKTSPSRGQLVGVDVEPALIPALLRLPETQRVAVWLVHACQWRYAEVAVALNTTTSMVGNHVSRGLARLRQQLEVHSRA